MASQSFDSRLRGSPVVAALSLRVSQLGVEVSELEAQLAGLSELVAVLEARLSRLEFSGRP